MGSPAIVGKWRTRTGLVACAAGGLMLGLALASSVPASADEPAITVKVGQADPQTGSVRVSVRLSQGCYDGFADMPRHRCWTSGTPLRLDVTNATSHGTISGMRWKGSSGSLTYTPTAQARHAAAKLTAPASEKRDRFRVALVDDKGGSLSASVRVSISPHNSPPSLPNTHPIVGSMDSQGVVRGTVGATDPDGDPLSYAITTPPTQGTAVVNADGSFVYTRNSGSNASAISARTFSDLLSITVTDGYGGAVPVPVTVTG